MKALIVLVALLLAVSNALADTKTTSKGDYPLVGSSTHTTAIREHVHTYEDTDTDTTIPDTDTHAFVPKKRDPEAGIGLDLVVYENEEKLVEEVTIETKYDFANDDTKVYLVGKINLWEKIKGE